MKGRRINEEAAAVFAAPDSVVAKVREVLGKGKAAGRIAIAHGCRWCRKAFRTTGDRAEHERDVHTYKRRGEEA